MQASSVAAHVQPAPNDQAPPAVVPNAPSPGAAPSSAPSPGPASVAAQPPGAQAMPALLSLAASGRSGTTTLRLDPAELGRLDIRIARISGGGTEVSLTATRPATLELLVRDQAALHQALDQAGIPQEGRSLSFHLAAAPETLPAMAAPPAPPANPASFAGHTQPAHPTPPPQAGTESRGEAAGSSGASIGGGHPGGQGGGQSGGSGGGPGGDGASQGGQRPSGGARFARAWPTPATGTVASSVAPGRTAIDITA